MYSSTDQGEVYADPEDCQVLEEIRAILAGSYNPTDQGGLYAETKAAVL
jgi:hypothetical protein